MDDGSVALNAVLEHGFDPAATAVVGGDAGLAPGSGTASGTATYREARPEDVRIEAFANGPSLVVVRNAWERGWEATVDGEPAPLLRVDFFLQAVPVGGGHHEVRLVYREPAIAIGLLASALVWLVFTGAVAASVALARRGATPRPAPPPGA